MSTSKTRRPGQRPPSDETARLKAAFLEDFRERGIVMRSAKALGIARRTVYDWKQHDPEFAAAYADAGDDANDAIRDEIWRRAVEGFDEEMVQGGHKFIVRKFSDSMLRLLAQSRMNEFRDKMDVTTAGQTLGSHEAIAILSSDPDVTSHLTAALERLASARGDASGAGVLGEQG